MRNVVPPHLALVLMAVSSVGGLACADEPAGPPVSGYPTLKLGLAELSGLTYVDGTLIGVSDSRAVAMRMAASGGAADTVSLPLPPNSNGAQLEGIAVDAHGRWWLLEEAPGRIFVVIPDAATARLGATYTLTVPPGDPLAAAWAKTPNHRGEGLVLLGAGHVLVAKQKDPVALIEFGPPGAQPIGVTAEGPPDDAELPPDGALVPLAVWFPDTSAAVFVDLSDLARSPDAVWLLGGRSRRVAHLDLPLLPATTTFSCDTIRTLPATRGGLLFEGLAIDPAGTLYLGVDRKRNDDEIVVLAPEL